MSAPPTGRRAPRGVRTVFDTAPGTTRVVLIRHGEATCNVEGVVGGRGGCTGLTATGRRQAEALAARLLETGELAGAGALYSSVLPARRRDGGASLRRASVRARHRVEDCDLCELHPGEADGLTWDEFRDRYGEPDFDADPDAVVAPGGESWSSFVDACRGSRGPGGGRPSRRARRDRVPRRCHRVDAARLLAGGAGAGAWAWPPSTPRSPSGRRGSGDGAWSATTTPPTCGRSRSDPDDGGRGRLRRGASAGVVAVEALPVRLVGVLGHPHAPGGKEVAVLRRVGDGVGAVGLRVARVPGDPQRDRGLEVPGDAVPR